jgi:cytochrome c
MPACTACRARTGCGPSQTRDESYRPPIWGTGTHTGHGPPPPCLR